MRDWVDKPRIDAGVKAGLTTAELDQIKALKNELAEVKRAKEILKTASTHFSRPRSSAADS